VYIKLRLLVASLTQQKERIAKKRGIMKRSRVLPGNVDVVTFRNDVRPSSSEETGQSGADRDKNV
jgi:hypothetical protein